MPVENYLASLREKHASLDRLIWEEEQRAWPNELELKRMKLEKLYIKEQIDGLVPPSPQAAAE